MTSVDKLLQSPEDLTVRITRTLSDACRKADCLPETLADETFPSAVLLLLSPGFHYRQKSPCLILNKRSQRVKQPGDICCPGGSVSPLFDAGLAGLMALPGSSVKDWRRRTGGNPAHPAWFKALRILFAAGLRESFEEMRLNPFGVQLLGPLPPQQLVMFRRIIYPIAAWVPRQRRFRTNWEVEKIVSIPLTDLLSSGRYAAYRPHIASRLVKKFRRTTQDYPCFVFYDGRQREILWGATYRIIARFLDIVFDFRPPDMSTLPVIHGKLDAAYLTGAERRNGSKP